LGIGIDDDKINRAVEMRIHPGNGVSASSADSDNLNIRSVRQPDFFGRL
jgi:hypothetical protein